MAGGGLEPPPVGACPALQALRGRAGLRGRSSLGAAAPALRPRRSPPAPLALRRQGSEGRESVQIRCESGVLRGDWRTVLGGGRSKPRYARLFWYHPLGGLREVLRNARGSHRRGGAPAERACGGVADRARSPRCPGRVERGALAENDCDRASPETDRAGAATARERATGTAAPARRARRAAHRATSSTSRRRS